MNEEAERKGGEALADRLAWIALLLGVAARLWGAWAGRFLVVPDTAVVGLMARHMAELKEFPLFFYGQAYMGSLEPMASAGMVRLLGSSGFAVNLGPVLFAAAALFFLWRWARDAAGPWGGLAALLAGLFGPLVYFHFQMAPRGGYMVALWVDALAIFGAARMAARLRAGGKVGWGRYLALGLLAGIGMWSNMIVVSALAVAALLLAHGMRWKVWRHPAGLAAGVAGFLAGLAPWLVWNARHGWLSLDMSQVSGHEPLSKALLSTWNRFVMLQNAEIGALGTRVPVILAWAVLGLAAWGAAVLLVRFRRATLRENYARAGALLFCAVFALVFATSGFTQTHTARYWVPVVPGLAVLAAVACAAPVRRPVRAAAWSLLGALALAQGALVTGSLRAFAPGSEAAYAGYREIGAALEKAGVDSLMAPIQLFPLNFALEERFAVSNGKQKFYEPILRQAECSDAVAYSSDFNGIEVFLQQHGAERDAAPAGGRSILWNVRRPAAALREIPPGRSGSLRDGEGADWREALSDRNLDTFWSPGGQGGGLEWTFAEPQDIHSIQLVFAHGMGDEAFDFPRRIRLEAKVAGGWRTLLADAPLVPLEWSGPRVYFPSGLARLEFRVAEKGVEALRLDLLDRQAQGRSMGWRLAETMAFAAEEKAGPGMDAAAVDALGGWLRDEKPAAMIYAPRWLSNQLLKRGWAEEPRLPGLAGRVFGSTPETPRDGTLRTDVPCIFVVEPPYADATRSTLDSLHLAYRSGTSGPWPVFIVEPGAWSADGLGLPPAALWSGDALLAGGTAARAGEALRRLRAGGEPEDMQKILLGEILRWRPSALSGLPEETARRLGGEEAAKARRDFARFPAKPCATEFANGLRLEGVEAMPAAVPAGGEIAVRLYWSAAEGFEGGEEIVFLHLRGGDGNIVAQDDYRGSPLLWGGPAVRPPAGECVEETRRIRVPAGTPAGPLDLAVGLYQPKNGRRVKVAETAAPQVRRHAVTWPAAVHVAP